MTRSRTKFIIRSMIAATVIVSLPTQAAAQQPADAFENWALSVMSEYVEPIALTPAADRLPYPRITRWPQTEAELFMVNFALEIIDPYNFVEPEPAEWVRVAEPKEKESPERKPDGWVIGVDAYGRTNFAHSILRLKPPDDEFEWPVAIELQDNYRMQPQMEQTIGVNQQVCLRQLEAIQILAYSYFERKKSRTMETMPAIELNSPQD